MRTVAGEQEVLELDVAVDQLPPMAIGHAQKHLPEECAGTCLRQATIVDHLAEELTLQPTASRHAQPSPWEKEMTKTSTTEKEEVWAGWVAHSLEDLHDDDESLLPIARAGGHSLQHILQLHNVLCAQNRTQRLQAEQAAADDG